MERRQARVIVRTVPRDRGTAERGRERQKRMREGREGAGWEGDGRVDRVLKTS